MFEETTGCGGNIGKHAWIVSAMVDMAAYAEQNGLSCLHQQLCHVVSCSLTGELAGCMAEHADVDAIDRNNVHRFGQ